MREAPSHPAQVSTRGFQATRISYEKYLVVRVAYLVMDIVLFVPLVVLTAVSRLSSRPFDIGLGPLPTINSRYHKQCLERFGYRSETFVYHTWYFTSDFDVKFQKYVPRAIGPYVSYVFCLFRYKCLYTYFTGGPLGFTTLLARCEPFLFRLAGIPLIDTSQLKLKETLRYIVSLSKGELQRIGVRSRAFVVKHHSIVAVGRVFHRINQQLGLRPGRT